MSPAGVAFILIILVISASVFITVSNMNKTVQELSNTVSSISTELNTIKQAINMTEDYRILLSLLQPIALDKLPKAIVLDDYIIHVVQGVGAGDILAPHLYDWSLDGVDDYLSVPTFSRPQSFTILSRIYLVNTEHENPITTIYPAEFYACYWRRMRLTALTDEKGWTSVSSPILQWNNYSWYFIAVSYDSSTKNVIFYRNVETYGPYAYYTISNTSSKIEIGVRGPFYFNGSISYVIIYNRVITDTEIQAIYNAKVVNASGLTLLLDPTFYNTLYIDLSGNRNHATPYNNISRIPANETWIWYIKNATTDQGVWLRFFPSGTLIVYRTGEIEKITSTEYYTNRTDIMLVMIPREAIK